MDLQFCDNCENLMFIYLDEDEELLYRCKNCNFQKKGDSLTKCIYRNDLQNKEKIQEMNIRMNDFIKYDPTLPSIDSDNITCPNDTCDNKDILYILNNIDEMKYTYICKKCNEQWSN